MSRDAEMPTTKLRRLNSISLRSAVQESAQRSMRVNVSCCADSVNACTLKLVIQAQICRIIIRCPVVGRRATRPLLMRHLDNAAARRIRLAMHLVHHVQLGQHRADSLIKADFGTLSLIGILCHDRLVVLSNAGDPADDPPDKPFEPAQQQRDGVGIGFTQPRYRNPTPDIG